MIDLLRVDQGGPVVTDFAFYNAGVNEPRGLRRLLVFVRRVLRRILRPIFVHQAELMAALAARIDAAEAGIDAVNRRVDRTNDYMGETIAFGWDYVAMGRRLAALEDRVESLQSRSETQRADDGQMHLPFPEFEEFTNRSKAC